MEIGFQIYLHKKLNNLTSIKVKDVLNTYRNGMENIELQVKKTNNIFY